MGDDWTRPPPVMISVMMISVMTTSIDRGLELTRYGRHLTHRWPLAVRLSFMCLAIDDEGRGRGNDAGVPGAGIASGTRRPIGPGGHDAAGSLRDSCADDWTRGPACGAGKMRGRWDAKIAIDGRL